MHDSDQPKPPAEWLERMADAGHWERLIRYATQSLAIDPDDSHTHRMIALAYLNTGRSDAASEHVDFVLAADPEDPFHQHLAAILNLHRGWNYEAGMHSAELLRLAPFCATSHFVAAQVAKACRQNRKAREHLRLALQYDPDDQEAIHLLIQMDGVQQIGASAAWERIRRLEGLLSRDPRNAQVLADIGDIYLTVLDRPSAAEQFFRQALTIEPGHKERQAKLRESIHARSLIYRTFRLPMSFLRFDEWAKSWVDGHLSALSAIPILLRPPYGVWAVFLAVFFVPSAFIYRWLVLSEIPEVRSRSPLLAPVVSYLAWPIWLRSTLALATIVSLWTFFLCQYLRLSWPVAFQFLGCLFGIHLGVAWISMRFHRWRARVSESRWQARADASRNRERRSLAQFHSDAPNLKMRRLQLRTPLSNDGRTRRS